MNFGSLASSFWRGRLSPRAEEKETGEANEPTGEGTPPAEQMVSIWCPSCSATWEVAVKTLEDEKHCTACGKSWVPVLADFMPPERRSEVANFRLDRILQRFGGSGLDVFALYRARNKKGER